MASDDDSDIDNSSTGHAGDLPSLSSSDDDGAPKSYFKYRDLADQLGSDRTAPRLEPVQSLFPHLREEATEILVGDGLNVHFGFRGMIVHVGKVTYLQDMRSGDSGFRICSPSLELGGRLFSATLLEHTEQKTSLPRSVFQLSTQYKAEVGIGPLQISRTFAAITYDPFNNSSPLDFGMKLEPNEYSATFGLSAGAGVTADLCATANLSTYERMSTADKLQTFVRIFGLFNLLAHLVH
jgi:hypothetical protein